MLTNGTHWTPYSGDATILSRFDDAGTPLSQLEAAAAAAELPVNERVTTAFFEAELVPASGVTPAQILHDGTAPGTATITSAHLPGGGA